MEVVHKGWFRMGDREFDFTIIKEKNNKLGFDLYCGHQRFARPGKIYGYDDDTERFTAFQIAVAEWLRSWDTGPMRSMCTTIMQRSFLLCLRHCFCLPSPGQYPRCAHHT